MQKSKSPFAVLVVEDQALIRMGAAAVIHDAGYEVYEASDADEAICMLELHEEIRILFTDVGMPGSMDGIKLAHYVRGRWPPIMVIVATGHPSLRGEDMPAESIFFSKPYSPEHLTGGLRQVMSQLQPT
jgi:CheY-like chemotaxis protein